MKQWLVEEEDCHLFLDEWLRDKKAMVVCSKSVSRYKDYYDVLQKFDVVYFQDFEPNPSYESTIKGREVFLENHCDAMVAIGGGSAIDVAKCIRLFAKKDGDFLDGNYEKNEIPFVVVPTTAGTGSEGTRFAVIYKGREKLSVNSEYSMPEYIIYDPKLLESLSDYQRKSTMLDMLSHALESLWSVNSTEESRDYVDLALDLFLKYKEEYLSNTFEGNKQMQYISYIAGRAINLTETTAGHAMCYQLTKKYGVAHGHAAMLVNRVLLPFMIAHINKCCDPRGEIYLDAVFRYIKDKFKLKDMSETSNFLAKLFKELELEVPVATIDEIDELVSNVNMDRLKNTPIQLTQEDIRSMYKRILRVK